ncbi:hypothetical protein MBANPS3_009008 [Mucor bainieri]
MKLKSSYLSVLVFTAAVSAVVIDPEDAASLEESASLVCPNYQLRCPECPDGQACVYPDSGGCSGAGVPVCQAIDCHGIMCLTKRLPCPKECPFSCRYNGPPCCPFLGQPECEPPCQTFAPCKVTPCPDDCPDDCQYPDADYCCPQSGTPVCNSNAFDKRAFGYLSGSLPEDVELYAGYMPAVDIDNGDDMWQYQSFGFGVQAYQDVPRQEHRQKHHHDNAYYHGDGNHGHNTKDGCPTCTKTVTDVSVQLEFVTTTREPGKPIECGHYIEPCPLECPFNCVYPMNEPCPFTQKPWCPSILDQTNVLEEDCDTIYNTEGYPYPYFPSYDPYHEIFTSILNRSGVTSTPSFVTEQPTEIPAVFCPLIFIMCPKECPDTCLRQNVPCPFANEGYCPGNEPPALPSSDDLEEATTPSETTLSDGAVMCPMYILACPYCPDGYSCTRETTGYCPNTNVPYCFSSATAEPVITSTAAPLFEFYPEPYPPQPTHWRGWGQFDDLPEELVYHAMSFFSRNSGGDDYADASISTSNFYTPEQLKHYMEEEEKQDICQRNGFIRIASKQIFDQVQSSRYGCEGCPELKWDDTCDNVCVFRTEKDCCIQSTCLSQ